MQPKTCALCFDPYFCDRPSDHGALGELCDQLLPHTVCCAVRIQWSFMALKIYNARNNKRGKTPHQLKMLVWAGESADSGDNCVCPCLLALSVAKVLSGIPLGAQLITSNSRHLIKHFHPFWSATSVVDDFGAQDGGHLQHSDEGLVHGGEGEGRHTVPPSHLSDVHGTVTWKTTGCCFLKSSHSTHPSQFNCSQHLSPDSYIKSIKRGRAILDRF